VRNYDILISSIAATIAGAISYLVTLACGLVDADDEREAAVWAEFLMLDSGAHRGHSFAARHFSPARVLSGTLPGARMVGQPYGLISAAKTGAY